MRKKGRNIKIKKEVKKLPIDKDKLIKTMIDKKKNIAYL